MPRVACLINASLSEMLLDGVRAFGRLHGDMFSVRVHYAHEIEEERVPADEVRRDLAGADLVLLDVRGAGRSVGLLQSALADADNTVVMLVGGSPETMALTRMGSFSMARIVERRKGGGGKEPSGSGIQRMQSMMRTVERMGDMLPVGTLRHARNWNKAMRYWNHGGPENVKNLLVFLGREYLGLKLAKPQDPMEFPAYGLYDPFNETFYETLEAYREAAGFDGDKPTVGLLFYGGMHFSQSVAAARALAERLATEHNLVPLFSESTSNLEAVERFFMQGGRPVVDAVAYFQWFQLSTFSAAEGNATLDLLGRLDVPVFGMAPMYGRETEVWRENVQGLSPVETMTTVIMPELDGMIETVPILGLEEVEDAELGQRLKLPRAIPEQADFIARRMARRVAQRRIPNEERRVAFIIFDTPPGEENIGNTSYLDVFASVRRCMAAMRERGYRVGELPQNKELLRLFVDSGAVNNARWVPEGKSLEGTVTIPAARYRRWWEALPVPQEVAEAWGDPPGEIMAEQGRVILPVLDFGNVVLGLQPARGIHSDPEKITHDKTLPPHHQYIAFYRWLEEEWGADAVVHVGTHGTLEFLKGKEVGQSAACWPANLIGSLPHYYIYHVVNPSEAMIAKRRSLGTLDSYNSPPLTVSGLYEEYTDLEALIHEYVEALATDPARAERVGRKVVDAAGELNLTRETVEEIQEELALMKRSLIPKGLHIMDEDLEPGEAAETVTYFLRYDRDEAPSLHRALAEARGLDYDALLDDPAAVVQGRQASDILQELEAEALRLVTATLESGKPVKGGGPSAPLALALDLFARYTAKREIPALLDAMEGGYTEPGIGGEPCRDPATLPTGRNTYQFDPRLVPSDAAYERGRQIAENTLAHYHELHGSYPKSTAVILWAFETAKTRGETVGQIFGYLGVKPVRKSPWQTTLEVVPLEELGRPRVDVTVQICGFFRDMFMNVVDLINQGFELVSGLDEEPEDNFVRPHTEEALKSLDPGLDPAKARRMASARVFGPRPGEYGTRVTHLIETAAWETEDDIVSTYMASMNHLYAANIHGERQEKLYETRLSTVQLVSQVRDTHDYEIGDLDHYYEYFGGLTRTVEAVRGEAPCQLITDTTKERVRTETVGAALERGVRTRLLNPKWVDHMLEHEVHGAQKVGERVENLIGMAATTHAVEDWVFSSVAERYLFDEAMRERMRDNNVYATEEIMRRLFEAQRRGYWNATDEEMEKLRDIYLELEGDIEDTL